MEGRELMWSLGLDGTYPCAELWCSGDGAHGAVVRFLQPDGVTWVQGCRGTLAEGLAVLATMAPLVEVALQSHRIQGDIEGGSW